MAYVRFQKSDRIHRKNGMRKRDLEMELVVSRKHEKGYKKGHQENNSEDSVIRRVVDAENKIKRVDSINNAIFISR